MQRARVTSRMVLAALVAAAPHLGAQSVADRVAAVKDGTVQMTFAARADVCGDGNNVVRLGKLITVYPSMRGHGWSDVTCSFGPVRTVVTKHDGEVTGIRTYVGGVRRGDAAVTDMGTVAAAEAAAYFLRVASSASGRAASSAVQAAAVADSADIWRQLLALARNADRPSDVRGTALYWMAGVAPTSAATELANLARNDNEPRTFREGVVMTLAQLTDGAGVPTLIRFAGGAEPEEWLRDRSIFWLGNAADDQARETLRTLASSDTLATNLRDQAIFALGFLDGEGGNGPFLRTLYGRIESRRLKDKIIQSVAQLDESADQRWLLDRVLDTNESVELRKQALFWRGQKNDSPLGELLSIYPRLDSRELRDHYVFVLSRRQESAAVDKLIDLARNDADREIRAKATFWLGQSRDPRATKYIEDRISK